MSDYFLMAIDQGIVLRKGDFSAKNLVGSSQRGKSEYALRFIPNWSGRMVEGNEERARDRNIL
jgi:hypothetical protein